MEQAKPVEDNLESESPVYQRALDLESTGLMGITPEEKYQKEVAAVFESSEGGFSTLPKGAKVLDLACGRGDTSKLLQEKGYSITGVDYSEPAIVDARNRFADTGIDFLKGNMMYPPKIAEGYDAITCFGRSLAYFEHYEDYMKTLRNWNDALADGGKVAIEWTEWADGNTGGDWKSIGNTEVQTEPRLKIVDRGTGESLSYMDMREEPLEYPGEQLEKSVEKHLGGRLYVDPEGKERTLGNKDTLFVDLLKERNFPLLKRMLETAGFENVRLIEAPKPLTPEGNFKTCKIFAITAEKQSEETAVGQVRGKIGGLL